MGGGGGEGVQLFRDYTVYISHCQNTFTKQCQLFKAPITSAADDIHKYFFIVLQRK